MTPERPLPTMPDRLTITPPYTPTHLRSSSLASTILLISSAY